MNNSSVIPLHEQCVCLVLGGKYEAMLICLLQCFITILPNILALKYLGLSVQGNSVSQSF